MKPSQKSYAEKLRNPRWQKKRLEIMQRDQFACHYCEDKDSTLNVHHLAYLPGKQPWEYDDSYLVTACETCHVRIESIKKNIGLNMMNSEHLSCIENLSSIFSQLKQQEDDLNFESVLWFLVENPNLIDPLNTFLILARRAFITKK